MAAIFVLAGGVVGFVSAILSLVVLDAGILVALAVWSGAGFLTLALGLALAMHNMRSGAAIRATDQQVRAA